MTSGLRIAGGPHSMRRVLVAAAVALVHALLLWLLLLPGQIALAPPADAITVVAVPEPATPPEAPTPDAAAAAPDFVAEPPAIVVPEPDVRIATPAPVVTAPAAADGAEQRMGAGDQPGEGPGAGGTGTGTGGIVRARWSSGTITRKDYPPSASKARIGGSVTAYFDVGADGSLRNCRIVRSSGNPELDRTTCRLIEQRFRYTPARNAAGEDVEDVAGWKQDWWLEPGR